ncbi:MAG TPA: BMP family protein [Gemmatimonadales bacterium]|jgi:basic membrane lipoprotein Med (substrate-binding protein (PBP1-ABC) superfamily)|nr:BMP family protein [Gemmatimonadales bacterium]
MGRLSWLLWLLAACARKTEGPAAFRVALITPGSIADAAWNSGAYLGLLQIRDSAGAVISHVEARTPGEQAEALRSYAAQGYDLVFGHGFEFQQPAERIGAEYPRTIFVVTSGERVSASGNVVPLVFGIEEGTYLAGILAGGMTKSNKIGFVGGMELPPIVRGYQGWVNGAKAVNPKVESRLAYLNTFDDVAAGREAALAMIRLGVDMLHHNADQAALGLFQAVKESPGVYAFGANAEQSALAPERVLASVVIDLPKAFLAIAREIQEGRFRPRVETFGLAGGVLRFDPNPALLDRMPVQLRNRVEAARDSIVAGTLRPLAQR